MRKHACGRKAQRHRPRHGQIWTHAQADRHDTNMNTNMNIFTETRRVFFLLGRGPRKSVHKVGETHLFFRCVGFIIGIARFGRRTAHLVAFVVSVCVCVCVCDVNCVCSCALPLRVHTRFLIVRQEHELTIHVKCGMFAIT